MYFELTAIVITAREASPVVTVVIGGRRRNSIRAVITADSGLVGACQILANAMFI